MAERSHALDARKRPARTPRVGDHVEGIVGSIGPKLQRLRQEQRLSLQQLAVPAEVSAAIQRSSATTWCPPSPRC